MRAERGKKNAVSNSLSMCENISLIKLFFLQESKKLIPKPRGIPVTTFLEKVVSDELFGFAKCDVHVPDERKEFYSQFPPIFKNVEVSNNDVGPYMKELLKTLGYLNKPRRTLISSFFGEGVVLTTDQIKWYLQNGK